MTDSHASLTTPEQNPVASAEERVARLCDQEISRMSSDELVELIRSVRMPALREDVNRTLPAYARSTLERLVHLTRRYCRNRLRESQPEPRPRWLRATARNFSGPGFPIVEE